MGTDEKALEQRDIAAALEKVVVVGDLSKLTPAERLAYYRRVCESLGLNPLTRPFEYITLQGRLTLYARRDAADQLRRRDNISITITDRGKVPGTDVYYVVARATTPDGRTDEAIGAVNLSGLNGESLANSIMKAETKAKRRVTLSICGLGWLDESEVDSVADAERVTVDAETGEIVDQPAGSARANGYSNGPVGGSRRVSAKNADAKATDAQRRAIFASARERGIRDDDLRAILREDYGVESSKDLTRAQASKLIDALQQGLYDDRAATSDEQEEAPGEASDAYPDVVY